MFDSSCYGSISAEGIGNLSLAELKKMPLENKMIYSKTIITKFWVKTKGKMFISFSGGKDSTVMLHLVRSMYPNIPAVFSDTGLEYPEIRDHVKTVPNVTWVKPKKSFKRVIEEYGYPVISKNKAHWISLAQRGYPSGLKQLGDTGMYSIKNYKFLVDAPFKVSDVCCNIMKKQPMRQYMKESGRYPLIGTRADESLARRFTYENKGDIDEKNMKCTPISIWTDDDIWAYIHENNLDYATIYDKGAKRTGCIFCMFGINYDKNRFVNLKNTHPNLHEYCMREREGRFRT